ncbi:hypothetical protein BpHYR1_046509 [Brachionus plicatilis]|uniref:Uncharacterized protein n=1 Tax=Brachionus plicatilis TaxID=10195 RepID=A0A3M7P3R4_BRAPC|nr:hypothetical protein BpHYR1_046509 [Brachionus plicatilis]
MVIKIMGKPQGSSEWRKPSFKPSIILLNFLSKINPFHKFTGNQQLNYNDRSSFCPSSELFLYFAAQNPSPFSISSASDSSYSFICNYFIINCYFYLLKNNFADK